MKLVNYEHDGILQQQQHSGFVDGDPYGGGAMLAPSIYPPAQLNQHTRLRQQLIDGGAPSDSISASYSPSAMAAFRHRLNRDNDDDEDDDDARPLSDDLSSPQTPTSD